MVLDKIQRPNDVKELKEQELPTFNRVGFVAAQWGGVRY